MTDQTTEPTQTTTDSYEAIAYYASGAEVPLAFSNEETYRENVRHIAEMLAKGTGWTARIETLNGLVLLCSTGLVAVAPDPYYHDSDDCCHCG